MSKDLATDSNTLFDAIIIGGGAAGLMCAATLGNSGKRVLLLDHANKVGKKILMSGGGRCNFTNETVSWKNYVSANPHFCKSALSRYTPFHFLELIYKHEIPFHEKTLGQLFCDNKAKDILNMLLDECDQGQVEIRTSTSIESISKQSDSEHALFEITTTANKFQTKSLVIATGGLSIPTMGATGFGYEIAKQFGLKITAKHASLVPFTFAQPILQHAQNLAGLSLPVTISIGKTEFHESLLFTHKGISGPAVLQISNYWWPDQEITIDFLPQESILDILADLKKENSKKSIVNALSEYLPKRFIQEWFLANAAITYLTDKAIANISNAEIQKLHQAFNNWTHTPKGTEGYKTAEVTRGGIDTDEISSKTFETKKVSDLYFIGEVLDVTGWLGGYNFQWAWASGWCAAQSIIEKV